MREKNDKDSAEKHKEHIQAWDRRMESIPTREPFFLAETTMNDDYLTWLRVVGKPYLLPPEANNRQIQSKRQRRSLQQRRKGRGRQWVHISRHRHPSYTTPMLMTMSNLVCIATDDDTDVDAYTSVNVDVDGRLMLMYQGFRALYGDDDEKEKAYRPALPDTPPVAPPVVCLVPRRNSARNRRPPPCSTNFSQ
ncbi:hypothetical protein Gogos_017954 [Gossypium gossypioides]|uniref:Uncharacterized protein n=1 Tax=Gossypium gossypioides TaxID=34282 RepID=A0A7J9BCK5_GOSGO|nr:hypothetical protein [Gossypium gossypioides]